MQRFLVDVIDYQLEIFNLSLQVHGIRLFRDNFVANATCRVIGYPLTLQNFGF